MPTPTLIYTRYDNEWGVSYDGMIYADFEELALLIPEADRKAFVQVAQEAYRLNLTTANMEG